MWDEGRGALRGAGRPLGGATARPGGGGGGAWGCMGVGTGWLCMEGHGGVWGGMIPDLGAGQRSVQSFPGEKGKLVVFWLRIIITMPECCDVNGFIFIYLFFEREEHNFPFNCLS